jgi:DNA-binding response OmpR family regulator
MLCERCGSEMVKFADMTIDIGGAQVKRAGREIHLTPTEFRILEFLIARPGRLIPRRQLWMEIYGADLSETSNALNVALYSLRRKLGKPELIHTIWARGVVLREPMSTTSEV